MVLPVRKQHEDGNGSFLPEAAAYDEGAAADAAAEKRDGRHGLHENHE